MDLVQLADLWEENQECLKQHLGQSDSTHFGARWVLMPTVPYPRFNHVSRVRVGDDQVDDLIASARLFFKEGGLPTCTIMTTPATRPHDLGARLYRRGFLTETNPVMIWNGAPIPMDDRFPLRVERAERKKAAPYWDLLRQVFFAGASAEMLAAGRRGVDISFEIGAINYIAFLAGRPAGAGTLFVHGGMGGIYNMCTLPRYQRNGVATAVLRACLQDAEAMGCRHVGLTPTPMGRPLYERVGFQEVYQELYFSQRIV